MRIRLQKWYLDCVSSDGEVRIGYAARLKLGWLPWIRWHSAFVSSPEGATRETQGWKGVVFPRRTGHGWEWRGPDRETGFWSQRHPGEELILEDSPRCRIRWHCRSAFAEVARGGIARDGYLESIAIDLSSAALPFKDLWWGRAQVGTASLVWIQWGRGRDRSWILRDGILRDGTVRGRLDGGVAIEVDSETWNIEPVRALRERDLQTFLPRWLVAASGSLPWARERKYLGKARLDHRNTTIGEGTAIGEIVQWN